MKSFIRNVLIAMLTNSKCFAFQTQSVLRLSLRLGTRRAIKKASTLSSHHVVSASQAGKTLQRRHFSLKAHSSDEDCLQQAVECAKYGLGATFPNPAVGCVLVEQSTGKLLGRGFHPRAGYPHAEIFALFQAAGLVSDGVEAALEIVQKPEQGSPGQQGPVEKLLGQYTSADGADQLFGNLFSDTAVTAYVTLEPCSHFGRTPPCAYSLAASKVSRVVVGFRDPNPRVDGGGVKLLQDAGITVEMYTTNETLAVDCQELVTNFCKRITPSAAHEDYSYVTGGMRRAMRALAVNRKKEGSLAEMAWQGSTIQADANMQQALEKLVLPARWMEELDAILWKEEIVQLRLNRAVAKKKGAKLLGQRIAADLRGHLAQTVGHTCLLYRPGMPPVMDLEQLVLNNKGGDAS